MTILGIARGNVFEAIYSMVEAHNGHFDYTNNDQEFIFAFGNADDKHDFGDAVNSLNINNVLVTKLDGLHVQVSM